MDRLSTQILSADIEVTCPICTFPIWAKVSEAIAQVDLLCPCCRTRVRLLDHGDGGTIGDDLESAMNYAMKGLF